MDTEPGHRSAPAPHPAGETQPQRHGRVGWKPLLVIGLLVAGLVAWGLSHRKAHAAVEKEGPVTVGVARVTREDLFNEINIPAEFRPYEEVELHAKVSGYVSQMKVDFGDKVKAGQLLAALEVPELLDQLTNAQAMVKKAEADCTNASQIYDRMFGVHQQNSNLVAQQEVDTAQAKYLSAVAALAAAKSDVEKYQTMADYTKITAPFDGVVTRRYADPGALIQAGTTSDTQSLPLVRISDNYLQRLDFFVSVQYVKDIHVGDLVEVKVDSLQGRKFTGKVTRFSDKVDLDTRTMPTEIEVTNADLEIVPGMYASVVLKVQRRPGVLAVPAQAISGGAVPTVYVVNDQHEIESRPVTLGLETPDKFEVLSGLKEGEWVMIGTRSFVHPGQKVETKAVSQLSME